MSVATDIWRRFYRLAFADTGDSHRATRAQSVEVLRILAAFGVVAFHAHAGIVGQIGYSGLVAFLFVAGYFEVKSAKLDWSGPFMKLIVSWAIWFLVFVTVSITSGRKSWHDNGSVFENILSGPSPHLWFLPFAFFAICLVRLLKRFLSRYAIGIIAAGLCLALAVTKQWWWPWAVSLSHPMPEYMFGIVPFFAGVAVGGSTIVGSVSVVLVVVGYLVQARLGIWDIGYIHAIGLAAAEAAVLLQYISVPWRAFNVQSLSRYMFGVYLSHPIFLTLLHGVKQLSPLLCAIAAFCGAVVLTWVASGNAGKHLKDWTSQKVPV